jgi:hypothetical protein
VRASQDPAATPFPLEPVSGAVLLAAALAVGAGALLGERRGDPIVLFAWLALTAPALGAAVGAVGARLWPFGLAVPGAWAVAYVIVDATAETQLPTPLFGLAAVVGLFAAGLALGALPLGAPAARTGVVALGTLVLAGASVQGGLGSGARPWAAASPALAAALLDLSPLVLVYECAGLDWTHAHPLVDRLGGAEWVPRQAYSGNLAGPTALVVGCALACLLPRVRRETAVAG